jgi:NADH dehydrogenase/NADH:ubiquinone oxidoreductase subunit G
LVIIDEGENGMGEFAHYQFKPDDIEPALALAQGAEAPVVVYGAGAGNVLPKLREALSDKAEFVGLVPGTNGRGALAVGLNGALEPEGIKGILILGADDDVDQALVDEMEDVEFVAALASYFGPCTERADVVLPTTIWAEKSGTFTNTEGRTRDLNAALQPPAGVKDDLQILKALAERLGA